MLLDNLDSNCGSYGKRPKSRPMSPGPLFRKAQSEPLLEDEHGQLARKIEKHKAQA